VRARRIEEHCNVPHHVPGDVHSTQLTRANEEIARLTAERDAYRAQLKTAGDLDPHLADLLVYAAGSLRTGMEAASPHADSVPTDNDRTSTGKPGSRPPRGGDPRARHALDWLVRSMTRLLDSFNNQRDNDWVRVQVGESAIDVRKESA
jgi:hypothetical protein